MKDRLPGLKVHFIGIGGVGMSGLAALFHRMGATISGSDEVSTDHTDKFAKMGLKIFLSHSQAYIHIKNVDLVIFSSAIKASNEEYQEALHQGIPLISRSEALSEVMRFTRNIVVTGSHGKTTTTALLISIFLKAHKNPSFAIGGKLKPSSALSALGKGKWFIAEADESDGHLHYFSPEILVITNIDHEHLDYYKSLSGLENSLYHLASRLPFYGTLIACGDHGNILSLFKSKEKKGENLIDVERNSKPNKTLSPNESLNGCFIPPEEKPHPSLLRHNLKLKTLLYGFKDCNDYLLNRDSHQSQLYHLYSQKQGSFRHRICSFTPSLSGDQNALNAVASILAGLHSGLSIEECQRGVENFEGVQRRMEHKGTKGSIDFYDDYGHHPTEIKALLKTLKEKFPSRRLVVLFQPHRFSRTRSCWNELLHCFDKAGPVYVLDIFAAGEEPIDGIHSRTFCENLKGSIYMTKEKWPLLKKELQAGDIFLTLGAGDVWKWGEKIYSEKM